MARVAPSERFRRELDDVLAGVDGEADPVERVGRLGARLILQQALEDEVSEFLGRARNASELGFESRILGRHVARTYALESLVICSFLRGCRCAMSRPRWPRPSM